MISRIHTRQVRAKLALYPAVAILGPRQCGKTTLARRLPGVYFDLETRGSEARLDAEWDALTAGDRLIILDEARCAPEVFSRLRGTIDADRKRNGRFLILGSVAPTLMAGISESLAGRLGLVRLSPFILPELKVGQMDDLWLRGGYPDGGILRPVLFPGWQSDYLDALASRDLPTWGLPSKPQLTLRLFHMLAAMHGQPLNASRLGASLSLDHKTVQQYCDFLEGAYLVRRLHLYRQPWLGASWEGFVIEQTLATLSAVDRRARAYFFRTSDGHELDLVLEIEGERWAVEIKLTSNPTSGMIARLHKTADLIQADRRVLVCRIARKIRNESLLVTNLSGWLRDLRD